MWELIFQGFFPGQPIATGRSRHGKYGTYTPPKTREYMKTHIFQAEKTWEGPVKISITFVHQRPKRIKDPNRTFKTTTPDIDNLCKMVFDILTKSGVWLDDNQVVVLEAADYYSSIYEEPHTTFSIYRNTIIT